MSKERRFLIPNEKIGIEHCYTSVICTVGLILVQVFPSVYSIDSIAERSAFLILELAVIIAFVLGITNELWALEPIVFCKEGIEHYPLLRKKRLVAWVSITNVYTTTLIKSNSDRPMIICCVLSGQKGEKPSSRHGMAYYRFHEREIFVLKYSELRLRTIKCQLAESTD